MAMTPRAANWVPQRWKVPRRAEEKIPTARRAPAVPAPKAAMVAAPQRGEPVARARRRAAKKAEGEAKEKALADAWRGDKTGERADVTRSNSEEIRAEGVDAGEGAKHYQSGEKHKDAADNGYDAGEAGETADEADGFSGESGDGAECGVGENAAGVVGEMAEEQGAGGGVRLLLSRR